MSEVKEGKKKKEVDGVLLAQVIALEPSAKQVAYFKLCSMATRVAYNFMRDRWVSAWDAQQAAAEAYLPWAEKIAAIRAHNRAEHERAKELPGYLPSLMAAPTKERDAFFKAAGIQLPKLLTPIDLNAAFTKAKTSEFPWIEEYGLTSRATNFAHKSFEVAIRTWFDVLGKKRKGGKDYLEGDTWRKGGFPRRKPYGEFLSFVAGGAPDYTNGKLYEKVRTAGDALSIPALAKFERDAPPELVALGLALDPPCEPGRDREKGFVHMRRERRFSGYIQRCTITYRGGRWFAVLLVDTPKPAALPAHDPPRVVGIDLGLKDHATLSTGEKITAPKPLTKAQKKLRKLGKELARRAKGSAGWHETKAKLQRLHDDAANVRSNYLHELSTRIIRENDTVVVEDLDLRGLMASSKAKRKRSASELARRAANAKALDTYNKALPPGRAPRGKPRGLARAFSDAGFAEFRRQLEYKAVLYGRGIIVADASFASTQLCSGCGGRHGPRGPEALHVREWACPACGEVHDRDVNAARNLAALASSEAREDTPGHARPAAATSMPAGSPA